MRVIVTGATSFVGTAVVSELLNRGHEVVAVLRPGSKKADRITGKNREALEKGHLFLVENDLSEPEKLSEKLPEKLLKRSPGELLEKTEGKADAFCHLGWGGSGSDSRTDKVLQQQNLQDALNTMKTARALGCEKFLFTGSQAEYGFHRDLMTEDSPCEPRSLYGEAKLSMCRQGLALSKELGLRYLHVRIFSAYGPGDHPWTLVESVLKACLSDGELALGACTQLWNFIYIEDLAKGICSLLETPEEQFLKAELSNPVFNLAGAETRELREFVEEIHRLCEGRGTLKYNARPENAEGLINLIPSIEKIRKITGWKPETDFAAGMKKTMKAAKY